MAIASLLEMMSQRESTLACKGSSRITDSRQRPSRMNAKGCSSKFAANRSSRVLTASLRSKLRMSGDETTHLLHRRKIGANPDPLAMHFRKCECVPTAVPVNVASRNAKRCPCLLGTIAYILAQRTNIGRQRLAGRLRARQQPQRCDCNAPCAKVRA